MKKPLIFFIFFLLLIMLHLSAQTWSTTNRLTWTPDSSRNPFIATGSGSNIHVVWEDGTTFSEEIYYKHSTDGGASWLGWKRLTWNAGGSYGPCIATDSSNGIHVVWMDKTPGNAEIYYKRSTDNGASWSQVKRLCWNSDPSHGPSIAVDSANRVHVVWYNYFSPSWEIYYKRSTDAGINWSTLTRLTWNSGNSANCIITVDSSNRLHVVWDDATPGNCEILYKKSTDSGATWSPARRLSWTSGDSRYPSVAADSSSGVYVVWHDITHGNDEVLYKHSTDSGTTWSGFKRLTWNASDSSFPAITSDSGTGIHVAWEENNASAAFYEIYYKSSTDSGSSWSANKRLTWNAGASSFPSIDADTSNGIHVVWEDNTQSMPYEEIFYKNRK